MAAPPSSSVASSSSTSSSSSRSGSSSSSSGRPLETGGKPLETGGKRLETRAARKVAVTPARVKELHKELHERSVAMDRIGGVLGEMLGVETAPVRPFLFLLSDAVPHDGI